MFALKIDKLTIFIVLVDVLNEILAIAIITNLDCLVVILGHMALRFIHYYKIDVELNYSEIEVLYKNYLSKYYFETESKNGIFSNNDADKISLKLSLFEPALSLVIEELFENSIKRLDDDLILFYIILTI